MILILRVLSVVLDLVYLPVLGGHYLYHRLRTGKYGADAPEKLGRLPGTVQATPGRKVAWFHAVSVGETQAAKILVETFKKEFPDWDVRVSTTTATGRQVAQKHFGADNVFYYPLDFSWTVKRVFDVIKPDLIVLMELEVWPQFLRIAQKRNVPVVVSNVRITERSVKNFLKFGALAKTVLAGVRLWLSQNEFYHQRLLRIGVGDELIRIVGSLKYDAVPVTPDHNVRDEYRVLFGVNSAAGKEVKTKLWVVGSTHAGEDEIVLEAFGHVRDEGLENLRLILVPRHPERLDAVGELAKKYGTVVRRSTLDGTGTDANIVLVDTMGELCKIYAAADVVLVAGSFLPSVGGHNIMEPCGLGIATITGPENHNFEDPVERLVEAGGILVVSGGKDLAENLSLLLSNDSLRQQLGTSAREALIAAQGATGKSINAIKEIITDGP